MLGFAKRNPGKILSTFGLAYLGYVSKHSLAEFFLGSRSGSKDEDSETKTWIWGNGFYQTGAPVSFVNFEPKLIKTFDGEKYPHLK